MSYRWVPSPGAFSTDELAAAGLTPRFDDQASAEEWLSLFYGDLLDQAVAEVSLYEEDRIVYGPMPLSP